MTSPASLVREDILALRAYHVMPAAGMVKLDAMESPYRLPEPLRAELGKRLGEVAINRYPDPLAARLKEKLRAAMAIPAVYLGDADRYPMLEEGLGKADAAEYLKRWRRDTDSAGLDLSFGGPFQKQDAQSLLCREKRREHPHRSGADHQDVCVSHGSSS